MRILVVTSELPPIVSGIAHSTDRLVRGLRQRGHEVDALSGADAPGLRSGEVRLSTLGLKLLRFAPRIARRYDVINVHGPVPTISDVSLILFSVLRRLGGPPILYTHHWTLEFDRGPLSWLDAPYMAAHQLVVRLADHVVVESEGYAELFDRDKYPPVSVVPCGLDASRFRADRVPRYDGGDPLRVLFVGQLRPYKGVAIAIDAVVNQPGLTLTVVGGGSQEDSLRRQIAEAGASNVEMTGYLDDDALVEAYRRHDVCVLPSTNRLEAFGLTLLEGMTAGCVPVASDLPGLRDLAHPNGLLFSPGDPEDLRWALQALAARPRTVERLQSRAVEVAAGHWSWDSACAAYEALAERLAQL